MRNFFFSLVLLNSFICISQFNFQQELSQRASIPQSPESEAFVQYGNVDINKYYGVPNISVPLYTIKGREMNLPITLSYDASGIKVNQKPTTAGLGWNLNIGGRISRQVNGLPDDFYNTLLLGRYETWHNSLVRTKMVEYSASEYQFSESSGGSKTYGSLQEAQNYISFLRKVHEQEYETQPDYFNLNVMGLNETFVLDLISGAPKCLTNSKIKISITNYGAENNRINTFQVVNDDGTKYIFEAVEKTKIVNNNDANQSFSYGERVLYDSSWYLKSITSPLGKDYYEFEYLNFIDNRSEELLPLITEVATVMTDDPLDQTSSTIYNTREIEIQNKKFLHKIVLNSEVLYEATISNNHLGGPDPAITNITVFENGSTSSGGFPLKGFNLIYDYFKTNSNIDYTDTSKAGQVRLMLKEVETLDAANVSIFSQEFEYDTPNGIPSIGSLARDYLGFYNGVNNNSNLIRQTQLGDNAYPKSINYPITTGPYSGSRGVNFSFAKRGLLNKIIYPTGGYSILEYDQAFEKIAQNVTTTNTISKASIQASRTTEIPFNSSYCNKTINNIERTPEIFSQNFSVNFNQEGNHYIDYTRSGNPWYTGLSGLKPHFMLIEVPDPNFSYTWDEIKNTNCEDLLSAGQIIYQYSDGIDIQDSVFLNEGHYQAIAILFDPGYIKNLDITGPQVDNTIVYSDEPRAGIRVTKITDFSDNNSPTKEKQYSYNTAVAITNPFFEYRTDERYRDQSSVNGNETNKDYQILHRVANAINGDKQHIVYPNVTESVIDLNNPSNSVIKTTSFKTPSVSQGTHQSGSFSYGLGYGMFSATNFLKNPILGAQKGETTTNNSSLNTYNTSNMYYQTYGVALGVIGRNNNKFPTIQEVNPNEFKIILTQGTLYPFFNSVILGGGSGTMEAAQPTPCANDPDCYCQGDPDCVPELSRLFLHRTYASGINGSDIQATQSVADGITSITNYEYTLGDRRYVKSVERNSSNGDIEKTVYTYPFESGTLNAEQNNCNEVTLADGTVVLLCEYDIPNNGNNAVYPQLESANKISNPIMVEQYRTQTSEELVSTVFTSYSSSNLPSSILTSKGDNPLEVRMSFEEYDTENNLLQARQENGQPVSFIWGYDNRYVVAKIENMAYQDIPSSLITSIKSASDNGNNTLLESHLNTLRNDPTLASSLMSSYLYKPNIGVVKMTDPTGYSMDYYYDSLQRLERVEDEDGNILSENSYNYKN